MTVCTPAWISSEHPEEIAVFGTRLLIVFRCDWPTIHAAIKNVVSRYTADNWQVLAEKLSRVARWEFAEYTEYTPHTTEINEPKNADDRLDSLNPKPLMRARLRSVVSAEVHLDTYWPEDPDCVSFPIELVVGNDKSDDADSFQMTVCTPTWLSKQSTERTAVLSHGLLIVIDYGWPPIRKYIEKHISSLTAEDWPALAMKLSRHARWGYADDPTERPDPSA
jgi:Immunity protein 8